MRIIHAAREGALGEVLALIGANPALVHAECADGSRPLACAASQGHAQVVECLVDTGAEIDHRNNHGWTAVYLASAYGHETVVALLMRRGADVTIPSGGNGLPLHEAAVNGHEQVLDLLLRDGRSDVDQADQLLRRPLADACHLDEPRVVGMLLEAGADPVLPTQGGLNALDYAITYGNVACAEAVEGWHRAYLLHRARSVRDVVNRIGDTPSPSSARTRGQAAQHLNLPTYLQHRAARPLPRIEVAGGADIVVKHVVQELKGELVVELRAIMGD